MTISCMMKCLRTKFYNVGHQVNKSITPSNICYFCTLFIYLFIHKSCFVKADKIRSFYEFEIVHCITDDLNVQVYGFLYTILAVHMFLKNVWILCNFLVILWSRKRKTTSLHDSWPTRVFYLQFENEQNEKSRSELEHVVAFQFKYTLLQRIQFMHVNSFQSIILNLDFSNFFRI